MIHPAPAAAADSGGWYDGRIAYTTITNCTSMIQGSPYAENGVGAYAGYYADPDSGKPTTNETFWIHYVVYGLGNSCNGGTYFQPQIALPPGVTFDTTQQIRCAYDGSGGAAPQAACPGWSNVSNGIYFNDRDSGTWGVAQGHNWEFQFPVRASQTVSNQNLTIGLKTIDGENNATIGLQAPVYVFGSGGSGASNQVLYANPSSVTSAVGRDGSTPTKYNFYSYAQIINNHSTGAIGIDLNTNGSTVPQWSKTLSFDISGYSAVDVWLDWDEVEFPVLTPNTTYYWRESFTPNGGSTVYGAWQSFTTGGPAANSKYGVASSAAVPSTGGGTPGGLSGGGALGGNLAQVKAPATVKAAIKGKLTARRAGKIQITVTSARAVSGTVTVKDRAKVVGRGTLVNGVVTVKLKKLTVGKHKLAVSYSGSSQNQPASANVTARVRR